METKENQPRPLTFLEILFLISTFFAVLLWSFINPADRFTWFLEVFPALIGLPILVATYKRFRFSSYIYWFLLLHAIVLMVGGHYTYAKVPLFDWISHIFDWKRNNYDKLGHFMQGFVPALLAQEILIRVVGIKKRGWVYFLSVSVCLAISASYELVEWAVAVVTGTNAEAFLGTQGYVWDTQSDMLWALVGAISSVAISLIKTDDVS